LLVILTKQHRWHITGKESGKWYAFCFDVVRKIYFIFFVKGFFEKGRKYGDDEDFRSLLTIVRCFGMWLEHSYFIFILKEDYNV
jgi:hypothetical protein